MLHCNLTSIECRLRRAVRIGPFGKVTEERIREASRERPFRQGERGLSGGPEMKMKSNLNATFVDNKNISVGLDMFLPLL